MLLSSCNPREASLQKREFCEERRKRRRLGVGGIPLIEIFKSSKLRIEGDFPQIFGVYSIFLVENLGGSGDYLHYFIEFWFCRECRKNRI